MTTMLFKIIGPDARACDLCKAHGRGLLLEDDAKVRKVFCVGCVSAILAAFVPVRGGGPASLELDPYDQHLMDDWSWQGNPHPPLEDAA